MWRDWCEARTDARRRRRESIPDARSSSECIATSEAIVVRSDATYLITGGLGGLGLLMAQWLVSRGARHLALMGRGGASESAKETLKELEQAGARIEVIQG